MCSSHRSRSADDIRRVSTASYVSDESYQNQANRVSFPTALPAVFTTLNDESQRQSNSLPAKERKKSILDLRRHFTGGRSKSSENVGTPFKELVSIWSRFPSHTRTERNGPAGGDDGVVARDFMAPATHEGRPAHLTFQDDSNVDPVATIFDESQARGKGKVKSMTLREPLHRSPADKARRSRKGILGRWKRLYRSSSFDLRKYAGYHGHRSSLSLGDPVQYPELECMPGEGTFNEPTAQHGETSPNTFPREGQTPQSPHDTAAVCALKPKARPDAVEWGKYYGECVGSLSALKSESDLDVKSALSSGDLPDIRSLDMRDSTVNFQEALGREQEKLKKQLLYQVGRLDGADAEK